MPPMLSLLQPRSHLRHQCHLQQEQQQPVDQKQEALRRAISNFHWHSLDPFSSLDIFFALRPFYDGVCLSVEDRTATNNLCIWCWH